MNHLRRVMTSIPFVIGKACDGRSRYYRKLEAAVPAYKLPALLGCNDGTIVDNAATWTSKRRPEITSLFKEHVYGRAPAPGKVSWKEIDLVDEVARGAATMRQVELQLTPGGPAVMILLFTPRDVDRPVPAFLGLNFLGNHTILKDPAIIPPRGWIPDNPVLRGGIEKSRGARQRRWPVEMLARSGFALATAYYGDIVPDHPGMFDAGVQARFHASREDLPVDDWGAIAAWAWGLSRIMDCLASIPIIDPARVSVIGHSRLGKAALWAGATDERFAAVFSNDSGCGGAALSRRRFGETVARINAKFPHWFCKRFTDYDEKEDALPVDQHQLLALVAPRPLYVASAWRDLWADPRGEFLSCVDASPAYRVLGHDGLPVNDMPVVNEPVAGRIGYHMRAGYHDLTPWDWERYIAFATRHLVAGGG